MPQNIPGNHFALFKNILLWLGTVEALNNPDSRLNDICVDLREEYQQLLGESKLKKCEQTELKGKDQAELDWYDKMLTQAEIQGHVSKVNCKCSIYHIWTQREPTPFVETLLWHFCETP